MRSSDVCYGGKQADWQKGRNYLAAQASLDIAFDTSTLEAETEKLQEELMVASDLIQKCIYENAHMALDQTEYQKRYDSLTARFDTAKARLEEIEAAIADKKSRRAAIEAFLDTLAQAD